MNIEVLRFRHDVYKTAEKYHQAQQLYLDTISDERPDEERRAAARVCLLAADDYEAALNALHGHLSKANPFEGRDEQMERTKKTVDLLREEKEVYSRLANPIGTQQG